MRTLSFAGLVKIELPGGVVVRLCDGGYIVWGAETFRAKDTIFGSVASLEAIGEGLGDEIPAFAMTLNPAAAANAGDLVKPGYQTARCQFWLAEYDPATSAVVGTPDRQFDGMLDRAILVVGKTRRDLALTIVATVEKLFEKNIGNSLNSAFHKSVWPGETGHDNASGLNIDVAWGTEKANGQAQSGGSAGGSMWRSS